MKDIEQRLRELGRKATDDVARPSSLEPGAVRKIRFRRLATIATSVVVVAGLAVGGTYAAQELSGGTSFDVSREGEVGVARYHPYFSPTHFVPLELSAETGTICYSVTSLPEPASIERIAILEDGQGVSAAHAETIVELIADPEESTPAEWDECVESVDRDAIATVIDRPAGYSLLVQFGNDAPLTAGLLDPPPGGGCAPAVDFVPTYLPEGWSAELQPGEGGGGEFPGLLGHYTGRAPRQAQPGPGFIDLLTEAAYAQGSKERIEVLGSVATIGAIHEGFSVEFRHRDCDFVLMAFGISEDELRRFAEGLTTEQEKDREDRRAFGAIWPEDNIDHAMSGCKMESNKSDSWRANSSSTAVEFAARVLGWEEATTIGPDGQRGADLAYEVRKEPFLSDQDDPAVMVYVTEVIPDCWSVSSVARMSDEQPEDDGTMSIRGREVQMFFVDVKEAETATFEVGYGGDSTRHEWTGGKTLVEFRLDFAPSGTGHFLILLKDENGEVYSAFGSPLPEGTFAAG